MNEISDSLPAHLRPYRTSAVFDERTMPAGLRRRHCTKPGVWGVIRVVTGQLRFRVLEGGAESILDCEHPGLAQPGQLHEVEPLGPVRFFIEFYGAAAAAAEGAAHERESDARHG
jgi:tellurite methyltransferase